MGERDKESDILSRFTEHAQIICSTHYACFRVTCSKNVKDEKKNKSFLKKKNVTTVMTFTILTQIMNRIDS